jgi:hypothetical protein
VRAKRSSVVISQIYQRLINPEQPGLSLCSTTVFASRRNEVIRKIVGSRLRTAAGICVSIERVALPLEA